MFELRTLTAKELLDGKAVTRDGKVIARDESEDYLRVLAVVSLKFEFVRRSGFLFGGYYRRGGKMIDGAYEGGEYAFIT